VAAPLPPFDSTLASTESTRLPPNAINEASNPSLNLNLNTGALKVNVDQYANKLGKGVFIMPIQSWYHSGWDKEPDLTNPDFLAVEKVMPFSRKW